MAAPLILDANKTLKYARGLNSSCILFYSGGKDSVCLLDLINKAEFNKIYCVFMYIIKDALYMQKAFNFIKKYPTELIQLPHPDLLRWKKYGVFSNLGQDNKLYKRRDYEEYLTDKYNTNIIFYGMKLNDSLTRRGMLTKASKSEIHQDFNKFYPIVNWNNDQVKSYNKFNNLYTGESYGKNKTSNGVSIFNFNSIIYLRDKYIEDYKRIINEFPLLDVKIKQISKV